MRALFKPYLFVICLGVLTACGGKNTSSETSSPAPSVQTTQLTRTDKTQAADYQNVLQELYIAYYGRPADPAGLSYWEGVLLANNAPTNIAGLIGAYSSSPGVAAVVNGFADSVESMSLYGTGNPTAFITAIYLNVLGRQPDPGGLAYWVGRLTQPTGAMTYGEAALAIEEGAAVETSGADVLLVNNRLTVANYFTAQVSAQNASSVYSGLLANAGVRTMLYTITSTLGAYQTTVNNTIATLLKTILPIVVDQGPDLVFAPTLNEAFATVTICAPANPTLCQTIDHLLIDTGSEGLRVISTVLTPAMASALSAQSSTSTLVECTTFVDGYTWGPVRTVNFQIGGETAQNLPMQVIGDSNFSSLVPSDCSGTGNPENTVATFGSNGVVGVGVFQQDCGPNCTVNPVPSGTYYTCSTSACTNSLATLAQQVTNPVSLFATDNTGVIISLPSVPEGGENMVNGTMTFGVGTQGNNALGSASIFPMDGNGNFTTVYGGLTMSQSYIDSGSNGLYFPNPTNIAVCPQSDRFAGFYCPSSLITQSATMESFNSATPPVLVNSQAVSFSLASPDTLLTFSNYGAYPPFGAPGGTNTTFDWGLPFFYGRNVFVVIQNSTVSGHAGPFNAF